jgi:serine/threonine-protein kinase RsbW
MGKSKNPEQLKAEHLPGYPDEHSENSVEMRIPAQPAWVRVARLATAGVAARLGFSYDDIEDLKLAVAEACNNAILHGGASVADDASAAESTLQSEQPASIVTIRWTVFPDRLQISVSDEGRIHPDGLQPPAAPAFDELPEGGMGLLLIQSLMDEVEYHTGPDSNTTLVMTRYAPQAGASSPPSSAHAASTSLPAGARRARAKSSDEARRLLSDALRKVR